MARTDELAPLLAQPEAASLDFRQGTVTAWDPDTGANTINVGGSSFTDLTIMNTTEAYSIVAGDVVGLLRYKTTYFVLGRIAVPGSGGDLAGFGTAARVGVSHSDTQAANTDSGYVAAGSPITFHTFTGRWVLILSAQVDLSGSKCAGRFSFSASGAQTLAADNTRAAMITDPAGGGGLIATVNYADEFTGTPGDIELQAQFRLTSSPGFPSAAIWSSAAMIVHPF